nr:FMRFamide receptor-like isoform X2 [Lepeophtheirus salmonis]
MRNSFNLMLIALVCMDSTYLLSSIIESFRISFNMATELHIHLFPYLLYPVLSVAMTASVFMTVGIALERYIAVHYPIDYSQAINSQEACKKRLLRYVIPVTLLSLIFNIPKIFEAEVYDEINIAQYNETHEQVEYYKAIRTTELRKNPDYVIYYNNWVRLMVIGIVPFFLLIYFNYKIYQDVKDRNITRQRRTSTHTSSANQQTRRKQEDNLAIVFMGIVLVFLVCHFPRLFLSMYECIVIREAFICQKKGLHSFPVWLLLTSGFSHVLLVINSSVNMFLYIFLNESFRKHFVAMFQTPKGLLNCNCTCLRKEAQENGSNTSGGDNNQTQIYNMSPSLHGKITKHDDNKVSIESKV